ncbi:hypothetical protein NDU88_001842 [Pleurodeles waltl]|uniref:Uncharacterized protein n=1 Tax=Pleurodeles waltl TaxID=8319 RepID=A0AAV7V9K0_PLEWA|nr:hypothetical protein NDU88_001842 [Pleurodeles waltl]
MKSALASNCLGLKSYDNIGPRCSGPVDVPEAITLCVGEIGDESANTRPAAEQSAGKAQSTWGTKSVLGGGPAIRYFPQSQRLREA